MSTPPTSPSPSPPITPREDRGSQPSPPLSPEKMTTSERILQLGPKDPKAFRISKVVEIIWVALAVLATAALISAVIASFIVPGGPVTTALTASTVALGVLIGLKTIVEMVKMLPHKVRIVFNHIIGAIEEFFAFLASAVTMGVNLAKRNPKPLPSGERSAEIPVLMIHGYFHNSSAWLYHRRELAKKGIRNVYTVNLPRPYYSKSRKDRSIDGDYIPLITAEIEKIKRETGRDEVILVGHSMGTVLALDYAARHAIDNETNVRGVFGIAGPVQGTKTVRAAPFFFAFGKCIKQLRRGSSYIKRLNKDLPNMPAHTQVTLVGSETDLIAQPPSTSVHQFHDQVETVQIERKGHMGLLWSSKVNNDLSDRIRLWSLPTVADDSV